MLPARQNIKLVISFKLHKPKSHETKCIKSEAIKLPLTFGVCAEVAALLALTKSRSNQDKFMQPSLNWQLTRQFWQHAVSNSIYFTMYLVLFSCPVLLNKFNSIPFLRSRLAVAEEISLNTFM